MKRGLWGHIRWNPNADCCPLLLQLDQLLSRYECTGIGLIVSVPMSQASPVNTMSPQPNESWLGFWSLLASKAPYSIRGLCRLVAGNFVSSRMPKMCGRIEWFLKQL
jgi:hypothetical protein